MNIYSHAVAKYIERVLNVEASKVGSSVKDYAKEQIQKTVEEPEEVYYDNSDEHGCPIYMRNGCAVPVKTENGEIVIPTSYSSKSFEHKLEKHAGQP